MEYKSLPIEAAEFKARPKEKTFEGYAATFGNRDLVGDVIHKGAFTKTIQERGPEGSNDIVVMWDHWDPWAMPKTMKENDVGLHVNAKAANLSVTDDYMEKIAEGIYKHFSIGYHTVDDKTTWDEDGTRHLHELKLMEFSVVLFPANEMAALVSFRKAAELNHMVKEFGKDDLIERARELKNGVDLAKVENARQALSELAADLSRKAGMEPEKSTPPQPDPIVKPEDEPEEVKRIKAEIHSYLEELRLLNEVKKLSKR